MTHRITKLGGCARGCAAAVAEGNARAARHRSARSIGGRKEHVIAMRYSLRSNGEMGRVSAALPRGCSLKLNEVPEVSSDPSAVTSESCQRSHVKYQSKSCVSGRFDLL